MSDPQEGEGSEIGALFPDQTITIGGEEVRIHALRFREGLELLPTLRPIIDGMQAIAEEAQQDPEQITADAIFDLIEQSPDAWTALMAASTDRDSSWIDGLPADAGEELALAVWRVNSPFLLRRLVLRQMRASQPEPEPEAAEAESATPKSSTS